MGAKIFYADKKKTRSDKLQGELSGTFRKKDENQSWGSSMKGLFKFMAWIGRYRIYRPYRFISLSNLNGWGHLVGKFLFGTSRSVQKKAKASLKAMYPSITNKMIVKWTDAFAKYMGMLFLDIAFRLPLTSDLPISTFFAYENFERLDEALAHGKGVIIPTLHIGQHLHTPTMLFQHPKHYTVSSIISVTNMTMYENGNRERFDNLYCYASTKFSKISPYLKRHMESNHILLMYHDYSSRGQLRVPFIQGKYSFLINTPQSYISLHRKTGAIILPAIVIPDTVFGKSRLIFLENSSIMNISAKYQNASATEFHGRLSTEINRILYPFARKYAHIWEELMRLPTRRCRDELIFEPNLSIAEIIDRTEKKMISILEESFEPERNDAGIKSHIETSFREIRASINNPATVFRSHQTKIKLTIMDSITEMSKICLVLAKEFQKLSEPTVSELFQSLEVQFKRIYFFKVPNNNQPLFADEFEKIYEHCFHQENFVSEWKSKIWRVLKRYILENRVTLKMEVYRKNLVHYIKVLQNCITKNLSVSDDELLNTLKLSQSSDKAVTSA